MSRIGKQFIIIPKDMEVKVDGSKVSFKKGAILKELDTEGRVGIELDGSTLKFSQKEGINNSKAFWGTYRALSNNIVVGLTKGFEKRLEINGVGYKAAVNGKVLEMQLGFSHPIKFDIPVGIDINVDKNVITVKGNDKQQVGQVSAKIRGFKEPEPYKGKGIKYSDEIILRKAGKTSKK